jgi:hypothetical protein
MALADQSHAAPPYWAAAGDIIPLGFMELAYSRLTIVRVGHDTYRATYLIDLPNPILRGDLEPDGNSKRTFTVIVTYSPQARSDLGVGGADVGGVVIPHVLWPKNCYGKQPLGPPALEKHCRFRGQFETTAHDGDIIWAPARICQYIHDIPQNIWSCLAMADAIDPQRGGTGGLRLGSSLVPFYAPARLVSVDPPQVFSRMYPTAPGRRSSVLFLDPETRSRMNVVRLRVDGTVSGFVRFPSPPSTDPVRESKKKLMGVGFVPEFRVRYRYDRDVTGYPIGTDPPPLKWSDLRYVFDIKEDCNGKEAIQA